MVHITGDDCVGQTGIEHGTRSNRKRYFKKGLKQLKVQSVQTVISDKIGGAFTAIFVMPKFVRKQEESQPRRWCSATMPQLSSPGHLLLWIFFFLPETHDGFGGRSSFRLFCGPD